MGKKIFVTATDTGAGKTFITSHLVTLLLDQGIHASAIKPIASGILSNGINGDVDTLLKAQHISDPNLLNLHTFSLAASPNIAATAEDKSIDPKQLVSWCHDKAKETKICLIEGIGGLMVPLNDQYLVSDWITDMQPCEVMLIVGARLGCINHALLTLEQLKKLNISPTYIIINALNDSDIAEQTKTSLQTFISPRTQIMMIPYKAKKTHFQTLINNLLAKD